MGIRNNCKAKTFTDLISTMHYIDSFIYVVRNAIIEVHFLLAGSVAVSTHMYSVLVGSVSFFIMRSNCSCNSVNVSKLKRWYSSSCKSFSRMHQSWSLFSVTLRTANPLPTITRPVLPIGQKELGCITQPHFKHAYCAWGSKRM